MKHAVENGGLQEDSIWILGSGLFFDNEGKHLNTKQSRYVWISHLHHGEHFTGHVCMYACMHV